jgi:hypothetical protein
MTYAFAFAGMFCMDVCYALYTKSLVKEQHIRASAYASGITLCMGVVTLAYVHNPVALLFAMSGAFAGTLVGSMIK